MSYWMAVSAPALGRKPKNTATRYGKCSHAVDQKGCAPAIPTRRNVDARCDSSPVLARCSLRTGHPWPAAHLPRSKA